MPKKDEPTQGITVKKDADMSEWYTQVIQKAELLFSCFGLYDLPAAYLCDMGETLV